MERSNSNCRGAKRRRTRGKRKAGRWPRRAVGRFERLEQRAMLASDLGIDVVLGPQTGFNDQPYVDIELLDGATGLGPYDSSFGIYPYNHMLLDTGANSVLLVSDAAAELEANGYQTEGTFLELGIGGYTEYDVSAPYRLDFQGTDGVVHTLDQTADQVRSLSNPDTVLGIDAALGGIPGIVGMPAMVDRVTTLGFDHWTGVTDLFELMPMEMSFRQGPDALPPSNGHRYSVAVDDRVSFDPLDGLPPDNPDGPLPVWAPVPFMTVVAEHNGVEVAGNFLFDTGAQFSLLSTDFAFDIGLDANGDGSLDDDAIMFLPISGVGGEVNAPVLALDKLRVPTEQGRDLVWQGADPSDPEDLGLIAIVLDIGGEGTPIDGVFGVDLLTSGVDLSVETLEISGAPYFDQVHFDFRDMHQGEGKIYFDVDPALDVDGPPAVLSVNRAGDNPTSAQVVDYTVTFTEAVTGVDSGDFQLATDGLTGASIAGVSGSGAVYTVSVDTGSGTGTLRLDVIDDDSITGGGEPLGGSGPINGQFTAGQSYSVVNGVASQTPGRPNLVSADDSGLVEGISDKDDITNRDNSSGGKTLSFSVGNTVPGARVAIYSDGTLIGGAVATGATTIVTSFGDFDLTDGVHEITARQVVEGESASAESAALSVTIDTVAPVLTVETVSTTSSSPSLGGTIDDPMARIYVSVDGNVYEATNHGDGTWSLPAGTVDPLAVGTYDIVVGTFDVAGNITFDDTTDELTIVSDNTPPQLDPIGHQTLVGTEAVRIAISASDADPEDVLEFTAQGVSVTYFLDKNFGFYSTGDLHENAAGLGEKWFQGSGGQWYYIIPNGELYRHTGPGATGTLVFDVGEYYHEHVDEIYDAPIAPPAQVSVETVGGDSTLVIDPDEGFLGTFVTAVIVSDGVDFDYELVLVNVVDSAPLEQPRTSEVAGYGVAKETSREVPEGASLSDTSPQTSSLLTEISTAASAESVAGTSSFRAILGPLATHSIETVESGIAALARHRASSRFGPAASAALAHVRAIDRVMAGLSHIGLDDDDADRFDHFRHREAVDRMLLELLALAERVRG